MLTWNEQQGRLTELLPWAALVTPGVVLNKDGSFQTTCVYRAPDVDSATDTELVHRAARLNETLRRLGGGWALFAESRRVASVAYSQSTFQDEAAWLLNEERRAAFEEEGSHFENWTWLTLQHLPARGTGRQVEHALLERGKRPAGSYRDDLEHFVTEWRRFLGQLADQMTEVRPLDDEEVLAYLHSTISLAPRTRIAAPELPVDLDAMLADTDFVGGLKPMLLRGNETRHLRVVALRSFPSQCVPAMLDALNALPFAYRWMTRFIALDPTAAEREIAKSRRRWFAGRKGVASLLKEAASGEVSVLEDPDAVNKAGDATAALAELKGQAASFGYFTMNIVVTDPDEARVEEQALAVERVLAELGFAARLETYHAPEAWLATIPGVTRAGVRRPLVSSAVLARLLPVSGVWAGPAHCDHLEGPALFHAKTRGSTPFRFVTHAGDVGHQLIVGPTGKGKSTLMALQALSFLRYPGARVVFFDKGNSGLAATAAVGGSHVELGNAAAAGFQPLAGVDDPDERAWAHGWVTALLAEEGVRPDPGQALELAEALTRLGGFAPEQRTLSGLRALVQTRSVQEVLARYSGASLGALFDANTERIADAHWITFEMETLLGNPSACRPALRYVFHRLEGLLDGRPTGIWIDEAWVFLSDPYFAGKLQEWLRTLRRANAFVVLATQSMAEIAASPIAAVLSESAPTRVWLPNERAAEPVSRGLYEQFGLNPRQIQIIGNMAAKREYYLQSPAGNRRFELGLGPIALALCAANSKADQAKIRELMATTGDFNIAWLQERSLRWAAALLQQARDHLRTREEASCDQLQLFASQS